MMGFRFGRRGGVTSLRFMVGDRRSELSKVIPHQSDR